MKNLMFFMTIACSCFVIALLLPVIWFITKVSFLFALLVILTILLVYLKLKGDNYG